MPVAGEPTFHACENKMKSKEGYSSEVAKKVCGKIEAESKATPKQEYIHSIPSPILDNLKEVTPADKGVQKAMHEWEFNPSSILASKRKVTGTFHVPKVDKDQELITKEAMDKAIPNFMHLPIMHDFHKERVLGVITKVWEQDGVYHYDAVIKNTHDVDDAWTKMQKGEYDHVSIYGSRLKGNTNCQLDPALRTSPCISEEIRLDSISACDINARNDGTELKLAKSGNVIWDGTNVIRKAMTMGAESGGSSLMHVVADGKRFNKGRIKKMRVREVDENERDYQENDMEKAEDEEYEPRIPLKNPQAPKPLNANQTRSPDNDNVEEKAIGENRTQRVSRTERNRGDKKHDINLAYGKPEREMKKGDEDETIDDPSEERAEHQGKPRKVKGYEEEESSHTHEEGETKKDKREERKAYRGYDEEADGDNTMHKGGEQDEMEKASKDGVLSKIYSMLKKLMKDDKEMVEKDEETHERMEKAESKQAGIWGADGETRKAKGEPFREHKKEDRPDKDSYGEEDDEPEDNEDKDEEYPEKEDKPRKDKPKAASKEKAKRFQKGRAKSYPKIREEPIAENPHPPAARTRGDVKEVEKGKIHPAVEHEGSAGEGALYKKLYETPKKEKGGNERKCPCKPATHSEVEKGKGDSLRGDKTPKEIAATTGRYNSIAPNTETYKINAEKEVAVNPAPDTMNINSYSQGALTVGEDAYKIKHEHTPSAGLPAEMYKIKKGEVSMETEDIIQKAKLDGEMTDEAFVVEIVKAAVPTDEIMKALTDLKEQNESLKAEIAAIKEQPIQKAVVQIVEDPTKEAPLNYAAEAEFFKKRV